jgi:hypothetical protein
LAGANVLAGDMTEELESVMGSFQKIIMQLK